MSKSDLLNWLENSVAQYDSDGVTPKLYKLRQDDAASDTPIPQGLSADDTRSLRKTLEAKAIEIIELSTHDKAKTMLSDNVLEGNPFVLFLRSFDTESKDYPTLTITFQPELKRHVELQALLPETYPIVGIRNHADLFNLNPIPSLDVPDDEWRYIVRLMIEEATFVVLLLRTITRGIVLELADLVRLKKQQDAVVLVDEPPSELEIKVWEMAAQVTDTRHYQPVTANDIAVLKDYNFFVVEFEEMSNEPQRVKEALNQRLGNAVKRRLM